MHVTRVGVAGRIGMVVSAARGRSGRRLGRVKGGGQWRVGVGVGGMDIDQRGWARGMIGTVPCP